MLRQEKGITLIALVITIIVLLILAGITIAMLSGQNGILTRSTQARVASAIGDAKDQVSMVASEGVTDYYKATYANSGTAPAASAEASALAAISTATGTGGSLANLPNVTVAVSGTTVTITSTEDNTKNAQGTFTNGALQWTNNY